MINKCTTQTFMAELKAHPEVIICSASYETRCLTVPKLLNNNHVKKAFIVHNTNLSEYIAKNLAKLKRHFGNNAVLKACTTINPLETADSLVSLWAAVLSIRPKTVLIDITTFTHESLLILLKTILINIPKGINVLLSYNGASDYAVGLDQNRKWLSKGISDVRSVLGYPGELLPSRKTHLIVLVGFEHERASRLIESYQPSLLSLGYGKAGTTTHNAHFATNQFYYRLLTHNSAISNVVNSFEFSANDPVDTKKQLEQIISSCPNHNHVIAPMNTKLSTIAAGFAAHDNSSIQICYAQPRIYNYLGYSKPSSYVYFASLRSLLKT